jgi:hypothetical protein
MKWRPGLLLFTASGSWLGFRLWQTIRLYREIDYYRKMNSPFAEMLLEGRQSSCRCFINMAGPSRIRDWGRYSCC